MHCAEVSYQRRHNNLRFLMTTLLWGKQSIFKFSFVSKFENLFEMKSQMQRSQKKSSCATIFSQREGANAMDFFEGESLRGGTFFLKKSSPSQEKKSSAYFQRRLLFRFSTILPLHIHLPLNASALFHD